MIDLERGWTAYIRMTSAIARNIKLPSKPASPHHLINP